MGEEHHAFCVLDHAQVPFELGRTGRDPHFSLFAPMFRFFFYDPASVAALSVSVVGLSHLSTHENDRSA